MGKSAILVGIFLILFGIWLGFKILSSNAPLWILTYSLISIGLGIALIILYKSEDKIEQRKDIKTKKSR